MEITASQQAKVNYFVCIKYYNI